MMATMIQSYVFVNSSQRNSPNSFRLMVEIAKWSCDGSLDTA